MLLTLMNVRLSYPQRMFKAEGYEAGGENPRYGCNFHIKKDSPQGVSLIAAIDKVADEVFKAKKKSIMASIQNNTNKFFLKDGANQDDPDLEDVWIISCNRKESDGMPVYQDRAGKRITVNDGLFYGGCYVNAKIDVFAMNTKHTGVWATLGAVQFVKDGESFGGAVRLPDDAFAPLEDVGENDPLAGLE